MINYYCFNCGNPYPKEGMPYKCFECGGMYIPQFENVTRNNKVISSATDFGYWKYLPLLGKISLNNIISLGEGNTPLVRVDLNGKKIYLKMESQNPTGSYKDRNSSLLISTMNTRGINEFLEDSSGNAGASIAAYAAKANMEATIFAPRYASGAKKRQIERYGATLRLIDGTRQETTDALLLEIKKGKVYGSHALMPFGIPGIATISYELVAKLSVIDKVIVPVGHGGLLYGIIFGFEQMLSLGMISKIPKFYGIQSENCNPFEMGVKNGFKLTASNNFGKSVAEGIVISQPTRLKILYEYAKREIVDFISVDDEAILSAVDILYNEGISVEDTSAVVIAGMEKIKLEDGEVCVAIISGHGLKTI